jgi:hypothetical protein
MKRFLALAVSAAAIMCTGAASATTYTSDPTLGDFASPSSNFATLSDFASGDVGSPYTPTFTTLSSGLRVYDGTLAGDLPPNNWILATFSSPVSAIRVFPNIDHFGAAYDGFQYAIEGSNDLKTWTPLFDALSVSGAGEPFTLGGFTGTAPTNVNNVLTPGAGPGGTVGYIADFNFGTGYKYYAFGASTEAVGAGNTDQELSAVTAGGVPEPATWAILLIGFGTLGFMARAARRAVA